ncbi:Fungal chitosanase [Caulobacter sp. AP07]|uniref:Fungal chitosanase n=1 Tax=Caulobacter sp. AP07 TaxID=1144304 RepID=UPI000271ED4F|nr:Fungal chitosanase [Caulobacter sp. AP07]EJL37549.1 Fungal chitosanase [Caulobacter sp. AP07]
MIGLMLLLALAAAPEPAPRCDMAPAFNHPDDDGARTTAVWRDAGKPSLLFADVLHVNTDGTKRSYRVDDFWGAATAVNNLCNAMSDKCAGLDEPGLRARRIATQNAKAAGWPKAALAATRISPAIIPFKNGKPCPEVDGYLVSATALHAAQVPDACDLSVYVDAMTVPAVVVPGRARKGVPSPFENQGVRVGDLAVVLSADGQRLVYAVVGDTGPAKEIGEGSIALTGALLGKTAEPANYREVRGKSPYVGKGWDARGAVLIFPGTRSTADPYRTRARIDAAAAQALAAWGGPDRLKACASAYKPR